MWANSILRPEKGRAVAAVIGGREPRTAPHRTIGGQHILRENKNTIKFKEKIKWKQRKQMTIYSNTCKKKMNFTLNNSFRPKWQLRSIYKSVWSCILFFRISFKKMLLFGVDFFRQIALLLQIEIKLNQIKEILNWRRNCKNIVATFIVKFLKSKNHRCIVFWNRKLMFFFNL